MKQEDSLADMTLMSIFRVNTHQHALQRDSYQHIQHIWTLLDLMFTIFDEIYEKLEHGFSKVALVAEKSRNSLKKLFCWIFQSLLFFQKIALQPQHLIIVVCIFFRRQKLVEWFNLVETMDDPLGCSYLPIPILHNLSDDVPAFLDYVV